MKYALLNCWTDANNGDLGIVFATIDLIREQDPEAHIIGVSCYSATDERFSTEHTKLRENIDELYPAIFGLVVPLFRKQARLFKIMAAVIEMIRIALSLTLPKSMALHVLKKDEIKTLEAIDSCDAVIAKGGSVFTCENTLQSKFGLQRMCYFYRLLKKWGYRYYIMGQSFGPVYGDRTIALVNTVIKSAEIAYVRESACLRNYPELVCGCENLDFSNDVAFCLKAQTVDSSFIDTSRYSVGITVRPAGDSIDEYVDMMVAAVVLCIEKHDACIYAFPQVTGKDEPDESMLKLIFDKVPETFKPSIYLYNNRAVLPQQLKYLYAKMDLMIGTRLHSTIFAMGELTPSICISYHGTKSKGIYENMGLPELVVSSLDGNKLQERVSYIVDNETSIKKQLASGLSKAQEQVEGSIKTIIARSKRSTTHRINEEECSK